MRTKLNGVTSVRTCRVSLSVEHKNPRRIEVEGTYQEGIKRIAEGGQVVLTRTTQDCDGLE